MGANGIAASALSLPDSVHHAKGPEACQLARRINEQLADIVSRHPTRFGAIPTLPALATTDGVLEEMAYALDTLKLDGVTTTTSIDDIYLGDTRYNPWFEEMNRRGVTLFVHQSQPRHLVPSISASTCRFWSSCSTSPACSPM
jgi:predicted TIM-barrel fold metal-dependent hydrolase